MSQVVPCPGPSGVPMLERGAVEAGNNCYYRMIFYPPVSIGCTWHEYQLFNSKLSNGSNSIEPCILGPGLLVLL